ncbi:hypothetical protein FQA47_001825 [Oryzias melastigma]|uniref:Uncharacterized protein n=1 Tax=Oryzias melastigma TaxID=30732 RepID=A0A834BL59_ORYME|nr:hypothetical protein FQA47_014491 [Oryzias melastigma]KAF6719581.1 hypothetical protein FQA47_001825 [Oryzias melastigma]
MYQNSPAAFCNPSADLHIPAAKKTPLDPRPSRLRGKETAFVLSRSRLKNLNSVQKRKRNNNETKTNPENLRMNSRQARHFPSASTDPCVDILQRTTFGPVQG